MSSTFPKMFDCYFKGEPTYCMLPIFYQGCHMSVCWYQILMRFHLCYHHVVHVNAFQMCLWSCLHILDAVNIHVWVLVLLPPLLSETVNTLLTTDLRVSMTTCACWSSFAQIYAVYICRLLVWFPCIKHSCRVYIIVCSPPPSWLLLDLSSCIQKRISYQPGPSEQNVSHRALWPACLDMLECLRTSFTELYLV